MRLRGIEFHAPEITEPAVYQLLSHPGLLERSGPSIQSLVECPYDGRWRPEDFPNCSQVPMQ